MNKELEDLKEYFGCLFQAYSILAGKAKLGLNRIRSEEKEFKEYEKDLDKYIKTYNILNDCDVDIWLLKHCDYENYCRVRTLCLKATGNADVDDANREVINLPTKEEFEFLKEVLS